MSRFRFELMHPMPVSQEGSPHSTGPGTGNQEQKENLSRGVVGRSRPDDGPAERIFVPDGQISESCPAPFAKIFRFAIYPNHFYIPRRLVPHEGRIAIVTDAGWDAVDADAPLTNGADADGEVVWS
jgi:hypothetical protein